MNIFGILSSAYWWMILIFFIVLYFKSPSGKGLSGEICVNLAVRMRLDASVYHLIKNVTLPIEDGTTQIDHIIVSEFGIFVIETKNYAGWIFGSAHQKMWTQKFPRSSHQFQNPLHQNYKHVCTLGELLGVDSEVIHSLIVFVGDSVFKTPMPENVTQSSGCIRFIKSKFESILSAEQVATIVAQIESGRLKHSFKTSREHAHHVHAIVAKKTKCIRPVASNAKIELVCEGGKCPRCGGVLILRIMKAGPKAGSTFIGCSGFPSCRFTRSDKIA
jgi:restriction system protein